jgi:hypothetical protein
MLHRFWVHDVSPTLLLVWSIRHIHIQLEYIRIRLTS